MGETIYADVLIITNIYINYALLLITSLSRKYMINRLRLLMAALLSGFYSLIIIVPSVSDTVIAVSRIIALTVMVIIAFGYGNIRIFLKNALSFLGVNFIFAGIMFMLWYLASPENMYFNSGVVYFDIDAMTLLVLTVVAYLIIKIITAFTKSRIPENTVYNTEIVIREKTYKTRGFLDTGNTLTDCFSGEGVIIISYEIIRDILPESIFDDLTTAPSEFRMNLLPAKTVTGTRLLPVFRADSITITDYIKNVRIEKPLLAISKERIHSGEFGVILYGEIFNQNTYEKGEINV